jgi:polycystin 1L2
VYGGGGYVADLGISQRKARKLLTQLKENDWIDLYTRAVFMEFTVFNPNINLFAYVNYLMEFSALGGVQPFPRVMTFQTYPGTGAMGGVVIACRVMYIIALVYFIVKEASAFYHQRKAYLKDPWNVFEIAMLSTSLAVVGLMILRGLWGKHVNEQLKKNPGNNMIKNDDIFLSSSQSFIYKRHPLYILRQTLIPTLP